MKQIIIGTNYFIESNIKESVNSDENTVEVFFGDEINKGEFINFINSIDLFGNKKVAIIRKTESIKDIKTFIKSTANCIETKIIFTANTVTKDTEKIFKEIGYNILKEEKLTKYNQEKDNINTIINIFANNNIKVNSIEALEILKMSSNDLSIVAKEAEKLSLYTYTNPNIKISELFNNISGNKEEPAYELINAISEKDLPKALKLLKSIQIKDNDMLIFFSIVKRFSNLYLAYIDYSLINENQEFIKKKIYDLRRVWKQDEIAKFITILASLDFEIKTGVITIEDAIYKILYNI